MLVVDDERVITFALQNYFVEHGFDVDTACESEEALALLTHKDYDIVIADLRLTGTTSEEGLDVIRLARERSSSTSIILLTAYRTSGIGERANALGADVLLQKPKPLPELAQTVFALMGSR
jgi:two-component system, OmpR family, response regulator TctD